MRSLTLERREPNGALLLIAALAFVAAGHTVHAQSARPGGGGGRDSASDNRAGGSSMSQGIGRSNSLSREVRDSDILPDRDSGSRARQDRGGSVSSGDLDETSRVETLEERELDSADEPDYNPFGPDTRGSRMGDGAERARDDRRGADSASGPDDELDRNDDASRNVEDDRFEEDDELPNDQTGERRGTLRERSLLEQSGAGRTRTNSARRRDSAGRRRRALLEEDLRSDALGEASRDRARTRRPNRGSAVPEELAAKAPPAELTFWFADDPGDSVTITNLDQKVAFAAAGLQPGDHVLAVDDVQVESAESFRRILRSATPGSSLRIVVERDGLPRTFLVKFTDVVEPEASSQDRSEEDHVVVTAGTSQDMLEQAGVLEDDAFMSLNGRRISSREDFDQFVRLHSGDAFKLVMVRDGRRRTIISPGVKGLTGARAASSVASERAQPASGLGNRQVDELGLTLDGRYEEAAVVQRVAPESRAARAGVRAGDHVVQLDGQPVRSSEHLIELYRDSDPDRVSLTLSRRTRQTARVTLESDSR